MEVIHRGWARIYVTLVSIVFVKSFDYIWKQLIQFGRESELNGDPPFIFDRSERVITVTKPDLLRHVIDFDRRNVSVLKWKIQEYDKEVVRTFWQLQPMNVTDSEVNQTTHLTTGHRYVLMRYAIKDTSEIDDDSSEDTEINVTPYIPDVECVKLVRQVNCATHFNTFGIVSNKSTFARGAPKIFISESIPVEESLIAYWKERGLHETKESFG